MIELSNLKTDKLKERIYTDNLALLKGLDRVIDLIKDPIKLSNIIIQNNIDESLISIYSSICMFLVEVKELISEDIDFEELTYRYMVLIRGIIQDDSYGRISLFGGLSDLGFGINAIYKATGHFKKFVDSFNGLIVELIKDILPKLINDLDDLKTESFDTMSGVTGVVSYLLLYKDEQKVRECIEGILNYLIMLTQEKEVFGHKVPNYYLSSQNHFLEEERKYYNKGSFNLGLSHGITGPLSILANKGQGDGGTVTLYSLNYSPVNPCQSLDLSNR